MEAAEETAIESLSATELSLAPPGTAKSSKRAAINGGESRVQRGKAQVVGWPPIRAFRRNCLEEAGNFVKVSMDGAPYLRKIDLGAHGDYKELRESLSSMFKCPSLGFSNMEDGYSSDYAIAYEDKDGDWMLAGDVPWEMFVSTCKRLRIMGWAETRGLAFTS